MHLHWDQARVVDAEGIIIDESIWDGVRSSNSVADVSKWFEEITHESDLSEVS